MSGRARKFLVPTQVRGVLFPNETWFTVGVIAARENCSSSDIVRTAVEEYIRRNAPDLVNPDSPETWGEVEWTAHARKHEQVLGYPIDHKCKQCRLRYPKLTDLYDSVVQEVRSRPEPKDFIDPRLKKEDSKRTRRPLKFFSAYDYRDWNVKDDSDYKVIEEHYQEHPDHFLIDGKRKNIDHAGHAHECEVCAEVGYIFELTQSDPSGINRDI